MSLGKALLRVFALCVMCFLPLNIEAQCVTTITPNDKIGDIKAGLKCWADETAKLKTALSAAEDEIGQMRRNVATLEREIKQLRTTSANSPSKSTTEDTLKGEVLQLRAKHDQLLTVNSALENENKQLRERISALAATTRAMDSSAKEQTAHGPASSTSVYATRCTALGVNSNSPQHQECIAALAREAREHPEYSK